MQTEKEFKELAQAWIQDIEEETCAELPECVDYLEGVTKLMWRSYQQGINDYIKQDS